jgi:serine/threonine protein kinase
MASLTSVAEPLLPAVPGYQLVDEIGRGGMGVVYRARDLRLNREVAIKSLNPKYAADSAVATRFQAEAQLTGQLQHPGIPAVHELGTLPDNRPFLAMKLVKGRTLQELLKERDDLPSPSGRGAGGEGAERGRFIAIFEQICHAVGYAHAHHVIHRDLKPSNVMVGAFGEVQVMDWGLAKVIDPNRKTERPAEEEDDPEATAAFVTAIDTPERGGSATRTGSVLGTPAYMAPEQAAGQIRRLDARSDVFGLGAILCQILTGHPPYEGTDDN